MNIHFQPNTLYYGDCLEIMADFPDNSINLICLDPSFNSNEKYHTIFKGADLRNIDPQIKAFDDMWLWDAKSAQRVCFRTMYCPQIKPYVDAKSERKRYCIRKLF